MAVISSSNPFTQVGHGIAEGAKVFFKGLSSIQADPSCLSRVVRIAGYIFALVTPTTHAKFRSLIALTDTWVDSVQSFGSVHSLVSKPSRKDGNIPLLNKATDVLFLGAGVGTAVQLADDVGAISLSTGSKITLGNTILGFLTGAFLLKGINSGFQLADAIKEKRVAVTDDEIKIANVKRNQAILDIIWCVSEVAFFVLGIAAVLSPVGLVAVGLAAASIGVITFLHAQYKSSVELNPITARG